MYERGRKRGRTFLPKVFAIRFQPHRCIRNSFVPIGGMEVDPIQQVQVSNRSLRVGTNDILQSL